MEPAAAVIDTAQRTVEAVARESYGRLVSHLAARTRDVAEAQDALSEAFLAALGTWPRDGVPDTPEAWLLTAARRRLIDRERHKRVAAEAALTLQLIGEAADEASRVDPFPDERLKLLFTCAHPAIDREVHTPLMLQTVLGLDAARIARAFLVRPSAMSQRLVRAKGKIRDAGIAFEVPDETELPQRLDAVLEAIYAAYGSGWEEFSGSEQLLRGLAEEAIWLARVLARLMAYQPYWAVRGHLLHTLERQSEASAAFDRAIALTRDEAVRAFLLRRRGA
jgi:RNA polymerase sigma-70 factor (ECF subfamily)